MAGELHSAAARIGGRCPAFKVMVPRKFRQSLFARRQPPIPRFDSVDVLRLRASQNDRWAREAVPEAALPPEGGTS